MITLTKTSIVFFSQMSDFVQYLRGNNTKAPYSKESTRAKIVTENSKKEILFTDIYSQDQHLSFPLASMEYTGVLRSGADELEYELSGIEQGIRGMTPEVARAIEGVRFIADHLKEEDEANNVSRSRTKIPCIFIYYPIAKQLKGNYLTSNCFILSGGSKAIPLHSSRPNIFAISCSFGGNFGKFIGWRPLLRGILDPSRYY